MNMFRSRAREARGLLNGRGAGQAGGRDKLLDDFRAVISDAEDLLNAAGGEVTDRFTQARAKLAATLEEAKSGIGTTSLGMQRKVDKAVDWADSFVSRNPWRAVAIAAGIGLTIAFVGLLLTRGGED